MFITDQTHTTGTTLALTWELLFHQQHFSYNFFTKHCNQIFLYFFYKEQVYMIKKMIKCSSCLMAWGWRLLKNICPQQTDSLQKAIGLITANFDQSASQDPKINQNKV
jgi:hypothetical protein